MARDYGRWSGLRGRNNLNEDSDTDVNEPGMARLCMLDTV